MIGNGRKESKNGPMKLQLKKYDNGKLTMTSNNIAQQRANDYDGGEELGINNRSLEVQLEMGIRDFRVLIFQCLKKMFLLYIVRV